MDVLIVGASARAAAQSARRAGLIPAAIDLFADTDLVAIAQTQRLSPDRFPHDLPNVARTFPPGPFLYTGGLENHPDVIAEIARDRPLWGVDPDTLRAIRNPFHVREILQRAGLPTAEVRDSIAGLPRDGSWLLKPRDSAGGLRIRLLEPDTIPPRDGSYYAQKRLDGRSLGALFLGTPGQSEFLGATESRQGAPGEPFAYAGGVGPIPLSPPLRDRIQTIGRILASTFDLRGLFGVDLIERDDLPIPIEINPRYTASVELLERAQKMVSDTIFDSQSRNADSRARTDLFYKMVSDTIFDETMVSKIVSDTIFDVPAPPRCIGKAVVYATAPIRFPEFPFLRRWPTPRFADIPAPGTPIATGEPILTVFASGTSPADTHRRLDLLVTRITRLLHDFGEPFFPESRTM